MQDWVYRLEYWSMQNVLKFTCSNSKNVQIELSAHDTFIE